MIEVLLALAVGGTIQAAPTSERTPIAFVGEQLSIESVPCESGERVDPDTGETRVVICMDAVFQASYRVLEVYEGPLEVGSTVTFRAADHYGVPDFARFKTALLFLGESRGAFYHIKYQWANAYPLEGGGFGSCGCDEGVECVNLTFSSPVTVDLSHASPYVFEEYRVDPAWEVLENEAVCVRGQRASEIYRLERPALQEILSEWR